MDETQIALFAAAISTLTLLIGVVTLIKGFIEYKRQRRQKRAEYFRELRTRFQDREEFERLRLALSKAKGEDEITNTPFKEKKEFLFFLEEVALAVNSGPLSEDVAHYMFGYYAEKIHGSKVFWKGISRNHWSWKIAAEFCERMATRPKDVRYDDYKF